MNAIAIMLFASTVGQATVERPLDAPDARQTGAVERLNSAPMNRPMVYSGARFNLFYEAGGPVPTFQRRRTRDTESIIAAPHDIVTRPLPTHGPPLLQYKGVHR